MESKKDATHLLHADRSLSSDKGISPPIYQSATYRMDSADEFALAASEPFKDEFYARHGTPSSSHIAAVIAKLEGAEKGLMFASGMAALTTTILSYVNHGDHIVAQKNLYSATSSFLNRMLPRSGVAVSFVDQTKIREFEKAITSDTKLIVVETPVNPLMSITNLESISVLAKSRGIITLCDNTFATPINQKPMRFGIDLIVHSVTKYIGGHHDLLAGCVVGSNALLTKIWDTNMDLGGNAAAFNSWLALRGIRTLKLRVEQHNKNAQAVAEFLEENIHIKRVYYPGLSSHPQHELAEQQMRGYGGMLSFELSGSFSRAERFIEQLKLCQNAASLGGVDSLVVQPSVMFKARLSEEEINALGISLGMVRMSVGIEDVTDIIDDLDMALSSSAI